MQDGKRKTISMDDFALVVRTFGRGEPPVVIEPGFGTAMTEAGAGWKRIIEATSQHTMVFTYDRPGLGASGTVPARITRRTSADAVRDLRRLLGHAQVPRPYVLVGHSIGGLHAQVFADLHPDEVAGMVLVDSTHPDQDAKWLEALRAPADDEPKSVTEARRFLQSRLSPDFAQQNPERFDYGASMVQARRWTAKKPADFPLAVLTHNPKRLLDAPLPTALLETMEAATQALQKGLIRRSNRSWQRIARDAGHYIPDEDPDLVIEAIREVLSRVRRARA